MEVMTDYDPKTFSVAADDGGRISVFDIDECPTCSGNLAHYTDDTRLFRAVMCLSLGCDFQAVEDRRSPIEPEEEEAMDR